MCEATSNVEFLLSHSLGTPHTTNTFCVSQEPKKAAMRQSLNQLGLTPDRVSSIIDGYISGWKGFVANSANPLVLRQIHAVPGLKIYIDKQNALVANVAISKIDTGATSKVKKIYKILPDGELVQLVRYSPAENVSFFEEGMRRTMIVYQQVQSPNMLTIWEDGEYISKSGAIKKRYLANLCEGTIEDLFLRPPAIQTQKALSCFLDALIALAHMHAKGLAHKDIKPANILVHNGRGLLADFSFTRYFNDPLNQLGTALYVSPQFGNKTKFNNTDERPLFNHDPTEDMFSCGITILLIYRPDLEKEVEVLQGGFTRHPAFTPLTWDEYATGFRKLQHSLREKAIGQRGDDIEQLAADLLDVDARRRPNVTQTISRLSACLNPQATPTRSPSQK